MTERKKIPYSERKFDKQNKLDYDTQYKKDNLDRIEFLAPKGYKDNLKEEASKRGMSVAEFIRTAIDEYISK